MTSAWQQQIDRISLSRWDRRLSLFRVTWGKLNKPALLYWLKISAIVHHTCHAACVLTEISHAQIHAFAPFHMPYLVNTLTIKEECCSPYAGARQTPNGDANQSTKAAWTRLLITNNVWHQPAHWSLTHWFWLHLVLFGSGTHVGLSSMPWCSTDCKAKQRLSHYHSQFTVPVRIL